MYYQMQEQLKALLHQLLYHKTLLAPLFYLGLEKCLCASPLSKANKNFFFFILTSQLFVNLLEDSHVPLFELFFYDYKFAHIF